MSQAGRFGTSGGGGGGDLSTLTGNTGGAVTAVLGNINVIGAGNITVTGNNLTHTLTISESGTTASTYTADTGTASPDANNINLLGGYNLNTVASGSTITFNLDNAIVLGSLSSIVGLPALTLTTGDIEITAGNINLPVTTQDSQEGVIFQDSDPLLHTFGTDNLFLGSAAGSFNLTVADATQNVGMGRSSLNSLTIGNSNSSYGFNSSPLLTSGSGNCSFGSGSLSSLALGSGNIAIGYAAGSNYNSTESDNILIGSTGSGSDSAVIRIGAPGTQTSFYAAGIDGVNVGSSTVRVVSEASNQLGTVDLVAGTNITITPTANTITIDASGVLTSIDITGDTGGTLNGDAFVFTGGTTGLVFAGSGGDTETLEGILVVENGGTGVDTLAEFGILYGNDTAPVGVTAAGTDGQVLTAHTGGAPTWEDVPTDTITITGDTGGALTGNDFVFTGGDTGLIFSGSGNTETLEGTLVVENGGTGAVTLTGVLTGNGTAAVTANPITEHSLVLAGAANAVTSLGVASNGQIPIGSTGNDPVLATITAGSGISISNGAGSITISNTGAGFTWTNVTATSQVLAVQNGYIANAGTLLTFTLPTSANIGDTIKIVGKGVGGWTIVYGTGQYIEFSSATTTTDTGSLSSTNARDCLTLVCSEDSLTAPIFTVDSSIGNILVV